MPNYRRAIVPGGSYFFTVATHRRRKLFQHTPIRTLLGEVIRECRDRWPFETNAIVLLPDHLHAIWTLPPGDANYSGRWNFIKREFTSRFLAAGGQDWNISAGKQRENRRGVWQRRFWEHTLQDEEDFECHFDYIHFNPVRHNLVTCPREWQASSFHRYVELGVYPADWACGNFAAPQFPVGHDDYGEPS